MSIPQLSLSPALIPAAMLVYGLLHSLTASLGIKQALAKQFGKGFDRYYRLIYSLFSVLSLVPIAVLVVHIPDKHLYNIQPAWLFLTIPIQITSLALLAYSLKQTGALQFIGVPQALGLQTSDVLNTRGLYSYIRHPLYAFSLLFIWLFPLMTRNLLLLFAAITLYMIFGAILEERKLHKIFGPAYAEYQTRTPFMIPFMKR
jgi:protein-S-isoprenylcysteine O-methyltransferase Ste14